MITRLNFIVILFPCVICWEYKELLQNICMLLDITHSLSAVSRYRMFYLRPSFASGNLYYSWWFRDMMEKLKLLLFCLFFSIWKVCPNRYNWELLQYQQSTPTSPFSETIVNFNFTIGVITVYESFFQFFFDFLNEIT